MRFNFNFFYIFACSVSVLFNYCTNSKTANSERESVTLKSDSVNSPAENRIDSTQVENFALLERHLDSFRLKPTFEIMGNDENVSKVKIGNHRVEWIAKENETKVRIDDDLFALKDKVALNRVWRSWDSLVFSNNWDQIRVYKHKGKEYVAIRMRYSPCNGIGCGVNDYLIYAVGSRKKNFFESFRSYEDVDLYDFQNDEQIDFLSMTFEGDAHGATPMNFIYELYSAGSEGQFKAMKNKAGKIYNFRITTYPNDSTKQSELVTYNWIRSLNKK